MVSSGYDWSEHLVKLLDDPQTLMPPAEIFKVCDCEQNCFPIISSVLSIDLRYARRCFEDDIIRYIMSSYDADHRSRLFLLTYLCDYWQNILLEPFTVAGYRIFGVTFQDQEELVKHRFEMGMKLEALHPTSPAAIHPATVVRIVNEYYFIVELDDRRELPAQVRLCCAADSPCIFPVGWCSSKGLDLASVPGACHFSPSFGLSWCSCPIRAVFVC